jgi:predicted GH43/DUF377 family glycosyl hydrolase
MTSRHELTRNPGRCCTQEEEELPDDRTGIVPNVVFPSAIDPVRDRPMSDFHVFYGIGDARIGVARLSRTGRQP